MNESLKDAVSLDDVLSIALVNCQDKDLKKGYTIGFYRQLVQRACEELAFEAFHEVITVDERLDKTCLQMDIPCNMFNLREIYLFNGKCSPESSVNVYNKRLFNNGKGGTNYTSQRKDINSQTNIDPFEPASFIPTNVYWARIINGLVMFSANSTGYEWVRFVGNGTNGDIGGQPVIPRFFRTAIADHVTWNFYLAELGKNDNRGIIQIVKVWDEKLHNPRNGSWEKALDKAKMLNTWERDSMNQSLYGSKDWGSGYVY